MNNNKPGSSYKPYLIGILGAMCWGVTFMVSKSALEVLTPAGLMASRLIVAVFAMSVLVALGIIKVRYRRKYLITLMVLGILQPCCYGLFEANGIDLTTASESVILLALLPIVTVIFNAQFLKEPMSKAQILFILLTFVGVIVTTVFAKDFSVGGKLLGYGFLMLAVLAAASYSILTRKISATYSPFEITFMISLVGLLFFNIYNFAEGSGLSTYASVISTPTLLFGVLFLGIAGSIVGFLAYNYFLSHVPAHLAIAVTISTITVTGVLAGILFLGEPATWNKMLGTAIIIAGVVGVSLMPRPGDPGSR